MHMTAGYILISERTPLITLADACLINGQSVLNEQQYTAKDTSRTTREFGAAITVYFRMTYSNLNIDSQLQ